MKHTIIILPFIVLILLGCEQTLDVDLPYDKRLVLDGFVIADSTQGDSQSVVVSIMLTKTIPALEDEVDQGYLLRDAQLRMTVDGTEFPCRPGSERFFDNPIEAKSWHGREVRIVAQGEGLTATALTRIPSEPVILQVRHVDSAQPWGSRYTYIGIRAVVDGGSVVWAQQPEGRFGLDVLFPMSISADYVVSSASPSMKDTVEVWMPLFRNVDESTVAYRLYVAEPTYARYLRSPYGDNSDPFGFGGVNPFFNVTGDGIGLMIGVAARRGVYSIP